jgi:bifunctional non-homologous end joining protein LigD
MSLSLYKKKRKFGETTEPAGGSGKDTELVFVVQKHAASHLHYDFRLEMEGVLKSWAVPKGPSLNPQDRRLAMMVEDHPYDYKDFEGTIPAGNYGAGEVIVWDNGSYHAWGEPDAKKSEKILLDGLKKGHITFILEGKKLKGEFALVKLKNDTKGNAWLLIKKDDEYATAEDILEKNRSVMSKITVESLNPGKAYPATERKAPKKAAGKKALKTAKKIPAKKAR